MKVGARPTDEQILAAMRAYGRKHLIATYVVRNVLAEQKFGGFDDLNTSHVLYRLKKLERAGVVRQVPTSYQPHIHWEVVE